jgi:N6-adenosine-specific RNA methylase IME4
MKPKNGLHAVDPLDVAPARLQIGLGQYARGSHELCLLGSVGTLKPLESARKVPSVFIHERTKHSAKPEAFVHQVIDKISPPGPRCEHFARKPRDGWQVWGNEVG